MRFGAHLPTYWEDYGTSPIHVAIAEAAQAAEALGYDGVWANDGVIIPAAHRGTRLAMSRSSNHWLPWLAWCIWCRA